MSYLRVVDGILQRRFPQLTPHQALALAEQIVLPHTRMVADVTEAYRDAIDDVAHIPELASLAKATVRSALLHKDWWRR